MSTLYRNNLLPWVCTRCRNRITGLSSAPLQRRQITEDVIQKRIQKEWQWKAQAQEIKAGTRQSMLSKLEERGYVNQITGNREELDSLLTNVRVGAYVGVDPTASSMHVGHLIPFMALFWMYLHGYHTVSLLGGATAKVGDPSGRLNARQAQNRTLQAANTVAMHYQLKKLWQGVETMGRKYGYQRESAWHRELCNNSMWLNSTSIVDLLTDMGSGLRMGAMLSRDTVKNRLEKGDGMSLSEFCYPVLQAWDWWHMFHTKGIQLQIGGSDQFGNIVSGMDAIKHIMKTHNDHLKRGDNALKRDLPLADHQKLQNPSYGDPFKLPMGFTVPLMTTSSGEKFGKSAGNAIWLDKDQTSVFDLYGYFVGTPDDDVARFLKLLTFMPLSKIQEIMVQHDKDRSQRVAQHALAFDFVELIHGVEEARLAAEQHQTLVAKRGNLKLSDLLTTAKQHEQSAPNTANTELSKQQDFHRTGGRLHPRNPTTSTNAPPAMTTLPRSLVHAPFARVLWSAGFASSRSEGFRLVTNKGAYVGSRPAQHGTMDEGEVTWTPIREHDKEYVQRFLIRDNESGEELLILRVGKWKVRIIKVVEDAVFEDMGLTAPGWEEFCKEKEEKEDYEREFGQRKSDAEVSKQAPQVEDGKQYYRTYS